MSTTHHRRRCGPIKTLDDIVAFVEQVHDDKVREFETSILARMESEIDDLDVDTLDLLIETHQKEFDAWLAQFRRDLPGFIRNCRIEMGLRGK